MRTFAITCAIAVLATGCKKPIGLTKIETDAVVAAELRKHPRPVHRGEPKAGKFGDVLVAHPNELELLREPLSRDVCIVGKKLDEACLAYVEATQGQFATLMEAPFREDGGFEPQQGALAPLSSTSQGRALAVCRRAAVEVDVKRERKDSAGAMNACADGLAWARDIAASGSMIGAMVAVSCTDMMTGRCRAALPDATPDQRHALAAELTIIAKGQPSLAETAHDDLVVSFLRQCGKTFEPKSTAKADPLTRKVMSELPAEPDDETKQACRERQPQLDLELALVPNALLATSSMTKYAAEVTRANRALDDLIAAASK